MRLNEAGVRLPYVRDMLGQVDLSMTRRLHAREVMCSVGPPDVALSRHYRRTLCITQRCSLGGVASPVMSNIYLDRFDRWVEQRLIPEYNKGGRRRLNPAYQKANNQIRTAKRRGDREALRAWQRTRRGLPSQDPDDPGYRRLGYVRYCDDFLLGFAGPKHEAEEIKTKIRMFLRDELKLELSEPKTLITHAASQAARFLGYEIRTQRADTKITRGRRMVHGKIGLFVPRDVIRERCTRYTKRGKPAMRGLLIHDEDYTIVAKYGSEYRGFVQYYLLAQDVYRLGQLHRVMEISLLKTLARKHRSTVSKMARKHNEASRVSCTPQLLCAAGVAVSVVA